MLPTITTGSKEIRKGKIGRKERGGQEEGRERGRRRQRDKRAFGGQVLGRQN